jgi:cob(I)alamin adenosyltransferase
VVYISKVYTKFGDAGDTMLASGDRVGKETLRIRSYGEIDELNSVIGTLRVEIAREPKRKGAEVFLDELDAQLGRIQQELFNLGAELSTPVEDPETHDLKLFVDDRHVDRLEVELDGWNANLSPLRSFVLPGGGPIGAAAHVARTVCRRAEREVVALAREAVVRPVALRYVNRLSDYFFVVARCVADRLGYAEVLWDPKTT